jgi:hypothetical protein
MIEEQRKDQLGGGVFLTIGPIAGLAIGGAIGQPSIGLVSGIAIGVVLAFAVWWLAR